MTFEHPGALWLLCLLLPLVGAIWRSESERRRRLARLGDLSVLSRSLPYSSSQKRVVGRALWALALLCLILSLAKPQWGEHTELMPRRGLDVVFALDVSTSMRARDVLPDRLERAKAEIGLVLDRLGENRVGLVAFAGSAFPLCPLTTDVEALRAFLKTAEPELIPQGGTALAEGMSTALQLFLGEQDSAEESAKAGRLLVIITDGEDHEGDVNQMGEQLKSAGVTTMILGVGSELGEPIPLLDDEGRVSGYKKDRQGQTIMSRMNPSMLRELAEVSGGKFIDGVTRPDLGMSDVEATLSRLEKRQFETRIRKHRIDRSAWTTGLALTLLAFAGFWPERFRRAASGRAARRGGEAENDKRRAR